MSDATPILAVDPKASDRARRASTAASRSRQTRRRGVDPTTCERDYTPAELEFLRAIQEYKLRSGRQFPTWTEVLEVVQGLGYEKAVGAPPSGAGA